MQSVVQRLASERSFLETLFNTIEDGVLVVDENGRILYFNQAVTQLIGLKAQRRRRAGPSRNICRNWIGKNCSGWTPRAASAWCGRSLR